MPSDAPSPVRWIIDPEPKTPSRVGGEVLLPAGFLDLWDAYLKLGRSLHPDHWQKELTPSGKFLAVNEFIFALEFSSRKTIPSKSIEGALELQKFAKMEDTSLSEPSWETARASIEPSWQERNSFLKPFFERYCEVRDRIYSGLLSKKITASGITSLGEIQAIKPASWRSRAGQTAATHGYAKLENGLIVQNRNSGESVHIIMSDAAIQELIAESLPESIDPNFLPCKNYILSLMEHSPFKRIKKEAIKHDVREMGIMPNRRGFDLAYSQAVDTHRERLGEEDALKTRWGKPGPDPEQN